MVQSYFVGSVTVGGSGVPGDLGDEVVTANEPSMKPSVERVQPLDRVITGTGCGSAGRAGPGS